jgi:hypothetical protein
MQRQQVRKNSNIDQTLEEALSLNSDQYWSFDVAWDFCKELCSLLDLKFDYDDGPPENWIDILGTRGNRIGLVCIYVPAVFLLKEYSSKEVNDFLCGRNVAWMELSDWDTPEHLVSAELLNRIFGGEYDKDEFIIGGEPFCFRDFWVTTVS